MLNPDLDRIAAILEGLEETIIHRLIDRAQFALNSIVYESGKSGFRGEEERSLLDIRLFYQEKMDGLFGRFEVPEERSFTSDPPAPAREVNLPPNCIALPEYNLVNVTGEIKRRYLDFIPEICVNDDDGQYGSSVEHDVAALQAISRRIHFGALYVAEAKYRLQPDLYNKLIHDSKTAEIEKVLTRVEVEKRILSRLRIKVRRIQAEINTTVRRPIDEEAVVAFYKDTIIPLTKEGEIIYLLNKKIWRSYD